MKSTPIYEEVAKRHNDGMTVEQIAEATGRDIKQVYSATYYARELGLIDPLVRVGRNDILLRS